MNRERSLEAIREASLYGIVDLGYLESEEVIGATAELLAGGVGVLQLRAKDSSKEEITEFAQKILPMCREAEVPLIINDFPKIAVEVGADGVHIGQDDGSLVRVRDICGPDMVVGRSTHSRDQAADAAADGFDYIGFGPLFPTPTKEGRPGIGLGDVSWVERMVGKDIPVFCIGGIKQDNMDKVIAAGAKRVVIVSELLKASSISKTTRQIIDRLSR